ncbi:MAG: 3'(2'),5'-bisphosphate nucleotidase CysQ [Saprospiraceae bacterium]|nr:3'(2'),5'-bisphosphate nucleotidase CysQ [Saprospiraceae bacterium]MBK7525356.1 3'(2'),5'-bisphosphate nucleotidase CysQ [Saprospiraceae bacterium]MBK8852953.1 3'(2'),5'-bisphosphate nucleotidase CysQ [Saprospiraceae bacterium]
MVDIDILKILNICNEASDVIMGLYKKPGTKIQNKKDFSPVTEADLASNFIIEKRLKEYFPDIPVISEESAVPDYSIRKNWDYCWIVDPLDGTREFINQTGEFTLNIALVQKHIPVAGFVHIPEQGITYFAIKGKGAYKIKDNIPEFISVSKYPAPQKTKRITVSRFHKDINTSRYLEKIKNKILIETGSSLKILAIAEGLADVYPRLAHLYEWDMAAGQIIIEEAGGSLVTLYGKKPLQYNKKNLKLPYFIASSKKYF